MSYVPQGFTPGAYGGGGRGSSAEDGGFGEQRPPKQQPMFGAAAHPLSLPKPLHQQQQQRSQQSGPVLVLCPEVDAKSHGYAFYGLVKPAAKEKGMESAAGMVNVIPRKRIYRMDSVEELETFRWELLKRPVVIQPTVKAGSGIQKAGCFFRLKNVNWLMMINQKHPKIQSTIMEGVDTAKKLHRRGEPYILEFMFSDIIRRIYYPVMSKAARKMFQYVDCEHGDLIIRYGGDSFHRGVKWQVKAQHIQYGFQDIYEQEILIRSLKQALLERESSVIQIIPENELSTLLPGWSFEQTAEIEDEDEEYDAYDDEMMAAMEANMEQRQAGGRQGRIKGRANRGRSQAASKPVTYEVDVELHVPGDDRQTLTQNQYGHDYEDDRYGNDPYENDRYESRQYDDGEYQNSEKVDSRYTKDYYSGKDRYNDTDQYNTGQNSDRYKSGHTSDHYNSGQGADRYNSGDRFHNDKNKYNLPKGQHSSNVQSDRTDQYSRQQKAPPSQQHNHYHQGSGRSGSSATSDSGYEGENEGGFEERKYGRHHPRKGENNDVKNCVASPHLPYKYDNPGFDAQDNYDIVENSVERNKAVAAKLLMQNPHSAYSQGYKAQEMNKVRNGPQLTTISRGVDSSERYNVGESVI